MKTKIQKKPVPLVSITPLSRERFATARYNVVFKHLTRPQIQQMLHALQAFTEYGEHYSAYLTKALKAALVEQDIDFTNYVKTTK